MSLDYVTGVRRYRSERVRSAKNRKISSCRWLQRHLNDPFVKEAKASGYRCRAAFKIIEIDQKYRVFRQNLKVVDLGSAPGGWSQVIVKKVGHGNVLAFDVRDMLPVAGVKFIKKNFLSDDARDLVMSWLGAGGVDIIASDMAPNISGDRETDHRRTIELAWWALNFATTVLGKNGSFISKIFQGIEENEFISELKKYFGKVKYFKPKSSRKDSPEMYIIAQQFDPLHIGRESSKI